MSPPSNGDFLGVFLGAGAPQVISLVGAGGKTSTLFWLASALYQSGARVLITTTTRMQFPDFRFGHQCVVEAGFEARLARLKALEPRPGVTALFSAADEQLQKVAGCLPVEIDALKTAGVADFILVEADGANHRALKAPAEHEPCIPASSDAVIALTGAEALMRPAHPGFIHRWPAFAALTGIKEGDILDASVFERLLTHPQGMFKNAPASARRLWLINGELASDAAENRATFAMLESIRLADAGLDGVWFGNLRKPTPFFHAWIRAYRIHKELQ